MKLVFLPLLFKSDNYFKLLVYYFNKKVFIYHEQKNILFIYIKRLAE